MYVCVCNAVTESDIRSAVVGGVRNLQQLTRMTGCGSTCGCCKEMAANVLKQAVSDAHQQREFLSALQITGCPA